MIRRLRGIRLSVTQLAIIVAASAAATAVVVAAALGGHSLPYTTLAALRDRVAVHTTASQASAPSAASTTGAAATVSAPPALADSFSAATNSSAAASSSVSSSDTDSSDTSSTDTSDGTSDGTTTTATTPTPTAKHVFVIALTTPSYRAAFGHNSVAHYLNSKLRKRGTLLTGYRTLGASELPDYLALISGQGPNADTRGDCATYAEFASGATAASDGQVKGAGCVYPDTVLTIGDQVTAKGKVWKAYLADMGSTPCMHPNSNALDDSVLTGAETDYATRHNPFIYFHSLLDLGGCSSDDVGLQHLAGDLRKAKRTPTYAFIAPGLCDDTSTTSSTSSTSTAASPSCPAGQPTGVAAEDAFLKQWVPRILASPAYKQDGVLMIVFAHSSPAGASSAAAGPVRTGALILSPLLAKAKSTVATTYSPYSILRTTEDLLGYTPIVHAKTAKSFATTVFKAASS
jgi:phosphatidylinositol-3-phosphatase